MSKRKRDYKKEYDVRIARGAQKGLSRSAARGHPRAGERRKPPSAKTIDPHSREELALRMMRRGSSLRDASNHYRMSQERLRAYLKETTRATRENGRWKIVDHRLRQFPFYSDGRSRHPLDEPRRDVGGRPLHAGGEAVPANGRHGVSLRRSPARAPVTSTANSTHSSSMKTPSTNSIIAMKR